MKSKEGKGEIVVFLIKFIIIGSFLCEYVCELNEISIKDIRLFVGKGSLPNRKSTSQQGVNNKIHTACSDLYCKSFLSSDSPESLP